MIYLVSYLLLGALFGAIDLYVVQSRWRAADRCSDYAMIGVVWLVIWPLVLITRSLRSRGNHDWDD